MSDTPRRDLEDKPEKIQWILEEHEVELDNEKIEMEPDSFDEDVNDQPDYFTGGIVYSDEDEIVLVKNEWSDGWITPGGTVEENETLEEGMIREIKEETGIENVEVEDPIYVSEQEFVYGDKSSMGYFILYTVHAEDTEIGDDLGADDVIHDAKWFDEVPENLHKHGVLQDLLDRTEIEV